jgi:hypothetical protein
MGTSWVANHIRAAYLVGSSWFWSVAIVLNSPNSEKIVHWNIAGQSTAFFDLPGIEQDAWSVFVGIQLDRCGMESTLTLAYPDNSGQMWTRSFASSDYEFPTLLLASLERVVVKSVTAT